MTDLTGVPSSAAPRRLRNGPVAVALLVVLAAAAWWLLLRDSRPSPGPLLNEEIFGVSYSLHPGATIGYGVAITWNTGERPAVLKRIRLVKPTPGLEVIGTSVSGPERKLLSLDKTPTWPSDEFDDVHPVAGYRVAPDKTPEGERGVELLFGLSLKKLGSYESQAVAIEYTVGDDDHLSYVHASLRLCVIPETRSLDTDCEMPSGMDSPIDDPIAGD